MRTIEAIERELDGVASCSDEKAAVRWLLSLAEEVLEVWVSARGGTPTQGEREGFRLLELHHESARGTPSFNACRETCREIAYHYNLVALDAAGGDGAQRVRMMTLLVRHLALFVGGKLQVEGLGDFCCASRPLRQESANLANDILEESPRNG